MPRSNKAAVKAEEDMPQEQSAAEEHIHTSAEPQFKDTLTELRKPVDIDKVKQRPGARLKDGSTQMFDYIEWHTATDILDEAAPGWSHEIKELRTIGELVAVTVAITIDGVTREGIGTGNASTDTGIKKAEHDALKRAAVKFGVARDLYKKEIHAGQETGYSESRDWTPVPPADPKATGPNDVATDRQVSAIYGKGKYYKIDVAALCADLMPGVPVEALNKKAASWFITYLDNMEAAANEADTSARQLNQAGNVVSMNKSSVSLETRSKLLFEEGRITVKDGGYIIADVVNGKEWPFHVDKFNDGIIRCSCGDYKTAANTKNDPGYRCAHKIAAEMFAAARK